jgi:N-acetylglucosaminyldiphosphoundecaprenol N-acetyl-beta-D-mannosaminyltransferase
MTPPATMNLLGTPLCLTTYDALIAGSRTWGRDAPVAVDFSNTQIVTMRGLDEAFRRTTRCMDLFVPDGMPLIWALNDRGAGLQDRVYGPTFLRRCIAANADGPQHYFLGGSEECGRRLVANLKRATPGLRVAGTYHGPCDAEGRLEGDDDDRVVREINEAGADFIWVGLGTPKQYAWIERNKRRLRRGVILAVGYAFDVNAGTKADAPMWMQRAGLTWLFRMKEEPRRLAGRYLKWNSLFLYCLLREPFLSFDRDDGPAL